MPPSLSDSKLSIVGTWEICKLENKPDLKGKYKLHKSKQPFEEEKTKQDFNEEETWLNGTVFSLHLNCNVTWHKYPHGVNRDSFPLLDASVYYYLSPSFFKTGKKCIEFQLPFDESIKFYILVTEDHLELIYSTYHIHCRKIQYFGDYDLYSVYGAYKKSLFSDYVITASDGKQIKLDKCVITAFFPKFDFDTKSPSLELLSSDALNILVEYLYKGVIPQNAQVETIYALKSFCDQHPEFDMMSDVLKVFLRESNVTDRILGLINDCETRLLRVASIINDGKQDIDHGTFRTHLSDPSKMLKVLKECFNELLIGFLTQLHMMYLLSSKDITKRNYKGLIKIILKRGEKLCGTIHSTLKDFHKHLKILSDGELIQLYNHCQPKVLKLIAHLGKLTSGNIEKFMKEVINATNEKFKQEKLKKSVSKMAFALKSASRLKEINQLRELQSSVIHLFIYFTQESKTLMTKDNDEEKIDILQQAIEDDLPSVINYFAELKNTSSEKRNKKKFSNRKNTFQFFSSYIRWFTDTVAESKDEMQEPTIIHIIRQVTRNEEGVRLVEELFELSKKEDRGLEKAENHTNQFVLQEKIVNLYQTKAYSDLIFHITGPVLEDTGCFPTPVTINAHRIIVSCRCTWFQRALSSGMKESIDRSFHITDTCPKLFAMFVKYLYTFKIDFHDMDTEELTEMLTIADKYEHNDLKTECENYLIKQHINENSAAFLLVFADKVNVKALKENTMKYIVDHPDCLDVEDYSAIPKHLIEGVKQLERQQQRRCEHDRKIHEAREMTHESDSSSVTSDSDLPNESFEEHAQSEAPSLHMSGEENNSLQECIETLRSVISAPYEELMRLALAADNDSTRALNFYFGNQ